MQLQRASQAPRLLDGVVEEVLEAQQHEVFRACQVVVHGESPALDRGVEIARVSESTE